MKELTEAVFATDNEDEAANARDSLKENNIDCTVRINTNNQMFGLGVLNDGDIISGGSYEVVVDEKDVDKALNLLSAFAEGEETAVDNNIDGEILDCNNTDQGMLDKHHFIRAMLLGFIHFLGFGTIAALISAWHISSSKKKMRFFAFAVPLCWYILVIFNFAVLHPALTVILICINIIVLILYILSPKRPAVYLTIFVSGLIVFTAAMFFMQ